MITQMKKGLVSVSFRGHTPREILEAAAACGLAAIEWGSDVHAPCTDMVRLTDIANMQAAFGLCTSSYGTYFRVGVHTPAGILPYIEAARTLGTDTLRVWCGDRGQAAYDGAATAALLRDCEALVRIAEREGVTLATEFHHGTYTDSPEGVLSIRDAVASSHLLTYWQPNQFRSHEENRAMAAAVAPLTVRLHVFHWQGNVKYPLAKGIHLWQDYLSCFGDTHYALLEFMPDGRLETLPQETQALEILLGGRS